MMPAKPQTRSKLSASSPRISTRVTKMTQKSLSASGSSAKVTSSATSRAGILVPGCTRGRRASTAPSALLGIDEPLAPGNDLVVALLGNRGVHPHLAMPFPRDHLGGAARPLRDLRLVERSRHGVA